jgi:hypothetical protein
VQVAVTGPVAAVEFLLDGSGAGRAAPPDWTARVDLGAELAPHELTARALDTEGHEIAVERQWLNLPRPPAEIALAVERDESGRAVRARISWQSLNGEPSRASVTWDGHVLALAAGAVTIPAYDPRVSHVLSVEMEFADGVLGRRDLMIGGGASEETAREISAVPLRIARGRTRPSVTDLERSLRGRGSKVKVVGMEEPGRSLVYVVRDGGADEAMEKLGRLVIVPGSIHRLQRRIGWGNQELPLGMEDRIRFLWPQPQPAADDAEELFARSRDFGLGVGLPWLMTRVSNPESSGRPACVADAVAVAGLHAFASYGARAVVLLLMERRDASKHLPQDVRRFLERLRVPLFVWSLNELGGETKRRWGAIAPVDYDSALEEAVRALRRNIATQRIVWVEGRYLPQEIELAEGAEGVELVR